MKLQYIFVFIIFWILFDYIFRKIGCWFSIKYNKKYCFCWDCKNPTCTLFSQKYSKIQCNLTGNQCTSKVLCYDCKVYKAHEDYSNRYVCTLPTDDYLCNEDNCVNCTYYMKIKDIPK